MEIAGLTLIALGGVVAWVGFDHLLGGGKTRQIVLPRDRLVSDPAPRAPRLDLLLVVIGAILAAAGIACLSLT